MIIKADSGSTKTDWVLYDDARREVCRCSTSGINPVMMTREAITAIVIEMLDAHPQTKNATRVEFFGSGCTPEASPIMESIIREQMPKVRDVEVGSDLIGAAHVLCGDKEGIACILGTGANSCLWDGKDVVLHTPCLGYILGDEGGGAVMGRSLLNILYKGSNNALLQAFEEEYSMSQSDVIQRVYRQPQANRWLASLSPFLKAHIDVPELRQMVIDNFRLFFRKNVAPYGRADLPVNFVGSIAYYYQDLLKEAAQQEGFTLGKILKQPL